MATICPQCKERFDEDSGFCPFDGTPLAEESEPLPRFDGEFISLKDAPSTTMALKRLEAVSRPSEYDQLAGTTLDDRYYIEHILGQGGMGVVFLARHAVIDKMVAVKVLKRAAARDKSVVKRFVQEARAASRIGHPNIVDVTDFGTTPDGLTYSVMEYIEGESLDQVIARHAPMKPARALPIVTQIARALGAAHEKGIVHRDLKPDNVFVFDRDGHRDFVKIVDFGIAKVTSMDPAAPRLTRAGAVFGTAEYMAPEQAAGRTDIDHRVDIYSLGIILYEMLVGWVPHKGDHMMRTLAMQMLDPIKPPRQARPGLNISDELEQVVLKFLAKEREKRFQRMDEVMQALAGIADDGPLVAKTPADSAETPTHIAETPGDSTDVPRPAGPRAWLLWVVAIALISGGVAAFVMIRNHGPASSAGSPAPGTVTKPGTAGITVAGQRGSANPADSMPRVEDTAALAAVIDAGADASPGPDAPVQIADTVQRLPHHDPGGKRTRPRRPVDIQVVTVPSYARLYIGNHYSGKSGTTIRKPEGTTLEVECRLEGYLPGRVKVRFERGSEVYMCKLTRSKRCVDGLKNPFDDCPE